MPSGIKIKEIVVGTGPVAERDKTVLVHYRGFLRRGEEICNSNLVGGPHRIDLSKREAIAGLRKGIEGMREGGKREITVSPHLAYGEKGVEGRIPPHAVIRFEVELVGVRKAGEWKPEDFPPGKHLLISRGGDCASNSPHWQLGLRETHGMGVTFLYPMPGMSWRHAKARHYDLNITPAEQEEIFHGVEWLSKNHPAECLKWEEVYSDTAEPGMAVTKARSDDANCLCIMISERGSYTTYYVRENCAVLKSTRIYQIIMEKLSPYMAGEPQKPA